VHAHRLLQCLTIAVRPLEVEELAEVLAVDFTAEGDIPKLNEDMRWENQEQAVLSACSSLITVVEDDHSRVVQFSHFSVKEFLTSDRIATSDIDASRYHHIRLEPAHTIMAQACLGVLLRLDSHIDRNSITNSPLAGYAVLHFGHHAEFENVLSHIHDGIDHLLDAHEPHFVAWMSRLRRLYRFQILPKAAPLYYVAELGFSGMVDHLISKCPDDVNVRVENETPLHAALRNAHAHTSQLLLSYCADVDARDSQDLTPLHLAADKGFLEVTRMLLERNADINARDSNGHTSLYRIVDSISETLDDKCIYTAPVFPGHGADANTKGDNNTTPMHQASFHDTRAIYLMFYHRYCGRPHAQDHKLLTPARHQEMRQICNTLNENYLNPIRFLLDHGADVNMENNDNSTPLHVASYHDSVKATQLLLDHGANIHAQNNRGETPFQVASVREHQGVVELLSGDMKSEQHF
jgi:ankyrin repeat protein